MSRSRRSRGPRRRGLRTQAAEAEARRAQAAPPPRRHPGRRRGRGAALRRRRSRGHDRRHLQRRLRPEGAPAGLDRPELVHLRGRQLDPRRDSGRAEPPAGAAQANQPLDAEGDGGDRGPPLLRARRHRRRGHRPRALEERQRRRGRRRRLDDHAAARPQPLSGLPRADGRAEAEGGLPRDQAQRRVVEAEDPGHLHEPGLLRQPRLRDRGGGADLLLQERERADPAGGCAACGNDAGAVLLRPVQQAPRWRQSPQPGAATRCCARATSTASSTTGPPRAGSG